MTRRELLASLGLSATAGAIATVVTTAAFEQDDVWLLWECAGPSTATIYSMSDHSYERMQVMLQEGWLQRIEVDGNCWIITANKGRHALARMGWPERAWGHA